MTLHLALMVRYPITYSFYESLTLGSGDFPLLVDGESKITGFTNIVSHLRENHSLSLDANLTTQQQRDRTAYGDWSQHSIALIL